MSELDTIIKVAEDEIARNDARIGKVGRLLCHFLHDRPHIACQKIPAGHAPTLDYWNHEVQGTEWVKRMTPRQILEIT